MSGIEVIRSCGAGHALPLARVQVARLAGHILAAVGHAGAGVTISLVTDGEIAVLNERFMGCTGPTNVLSFPHGGDEDDAGPTVFMAMGDMGSLASMDELPFDEPDVAVTADYECDCSDEGTDAAAFDFDEDPDALDADDVALDDLEPEESYPEEGGPEDAVAPDRLAGGADGADGGSGDAWPERHAYLGDLAISPSTVAREARFYGQEPGRHFARMLAHGILHLAGFEHGAEMDALVEKALGAELPVG